MNTIRTTAIAAMLATSCVVAQSSALLEAAAADEYQATAGGYVKLDGGGNRTWRGYTDDDSQTLEFEPTTYYAGVNYVVVVFVDDCYSCDVVIYWRDENGIKELPAQIERSGGLVRVNLNSSQDRTVNGYIGTYVRSPEHFYTYSLLFSKAME